MREFIKQQHRHIWIAILAILFNALAPSISHALAWAGTRAYPSDICSVSAPRDAGSGEQKAPAQTPHAMKHCLMCGLHGGTDGLPPAAAAPQYTAVAAVPPNHPFPTVHAALPHWNGAAPRAPPAIV